MIFNGCRAWAPCNFASLQNSGSLIFRCLSTLQFHTLSKPTLAIIRKVIQFEYHVISSSSKPHRRYRNRKRVFEYHVISSSSKPSKRWGFLIDLCSKWAQVLLRFLCAFQVEMYAKILGPVYLRTIRFYSSSKWADLICHTRYVWVPCNFTLLQSAVGPCYRIWELCNFASKCSIVWVPCNFTLLPNQRKKEQSNTDRLSTL